MTCIELRRRASLPTRSARATRAALCALVVGSAASMACGDGGGASDGATTAPPAPTPTTEASPPPAPKPTPTAAVDRCAPPDGTLRGDAAKGSETYTQICLACHGDVRTSLNPVPADHSDCGYMTALSDEHIFRVVCGGGAAVGKSPTMPPLGLPPTQIKNVIAHLRTICPTS